MLDKLNQCLELLLANVQCYRVSGSRLAQARMKNKNKNNENFEKADTQEDKTSSQENVER